MAMIAKFLQRRAVVASAQRTHVAQSTSTNISARSCVIAARTAVRGESRTFVQSPFRNIQHQMLHASRCMSTTTGSAKQIDVWEAVRVMKSPNVTPEERIEAITTVKVDAVEKLEKEQQILEVIESGAVETLVEFLKDADSTEASELLVPAFLSLIRLSTQPLIAQELIRLDAASLMTHFLSLPDPRLQAAACLMLGHIALEPASEQAVSAPNVIDKVLQVLSSPHEAIQRAGATCLANIAGNRLAREKLCETEAIFTLSELVSDEHSDAMRSAAAFALGNLLSGRDIGAQDMLRENGGLAELVMLLSPAFSEEVSSSAAWAIQHGVHLNHQSQSLVAEAGGLNLLVQHLSAATIQLQTNALLALASTIEAHVQNKAWCRVNGVVELLQQVEADDGDDMSEEAKRALHTIVQELA